MQYLENISKILPLADHTENSDDSGTCFVLRLVHALSMAINRLHWCHEECELRENTTSTK